jgi:hypothetical protein
MPIEVGVWRIDGGVVRVPSSALANESRLEDILEADISILGLDVVLVVGRQVVTAFGKRVDLMAVDAQGQVYAIELKRNRTPRDVVAQALDYGSWITGLTLDDVREIYRRYRPGETFDGAFAHRLGTPVPEELASSHQLIIVASALDPSTERIVSYLSAYGVPLNVLFSSSFRDGEHEYLTRSWLIDPVEAETRVARVRTDGPRVSKVAGTWNGQDVYVSLGEGERHDWDDCVKDGFVSGGQGRWYSQTLQMLFPGARIFAYIPHIGYAGVGPCMLAISVNTLRRRGRCTVFNRTRATVAVCRRSYLRAARCWTLRTRTRAWPRRAAVRRVRVGRARLRSAAKSASADAA